MKKFLKVFTVAALFVAAATTTASAQLYYGVKAGANISTLSAASDIMGDTSGGTGYQAGITMGMKVPIVGIGIEAEALWVNSIFSAFDGDIVSNSIEVPIMASIPLLPMFPLSIKVGPSFVLYNEATSEYDGVSTDLDPVKSSVGYTVGLGLKLLKFTLDVRYNGQFSSAAPFESMMGTELYTSDYDIRTSNVSISVGYRF